MKFHKKVKNHEFVLLSITTILRDTKKGNLHAQLQHESISHANVYPWKKMRIFMIGLNGNVNGKMASIREFHSFV